MIRLKDYNNSITNEGAMVRNLAFFNTILIVYACLISCNKTNQQWEQIKYKAQSLENKADKIAYENGCLEIDSIVKLDNSEFMASLKEKNCDSLDCYKLYQDSLGLTCKPDAIRAKYGPYDVNVFLQNTRGMDGYINIAGQGFKQDVADLLKGITSVNKNANHSLYHMNNKSKNKDTSETEIDKIIGSLNYEIFGPRGAPHLDSAELKKLSLKTRIDSALSHRKFIDIKSIIDSALFYANDTSMSIIISDFNIRNNNNKSIGSNHRDYILDEVRLIGNLINERKDLSLLVIRLESKFSGYYYDIKDSCYIYQAIEKEMKEKIKPFTDKKSSLSKEYNKYLTKADSLRKEIKSHETTENINSDVKKLINAELNSIYRRVSELESLIFGLEMQISQLQTKCNKPSHSIENSFSRPYFIWIFGTNPQIEQVLKTQFFISMQKQERRDYWIGRYVRNVGDLKLEIEDHDKVKQFNRKDGFFLKYKKNNDSICVSKIGDKNRKLEIPIKLTFGKLSKIVPDFFDDVSDYKFGKGLDSLLFIKEIKSITDGEFTHRLTIMSNDAFGRKITEKKDKKDTLLKITEGDIAKFGSVIHVSVEREFFCKDSIAKFSSEDDSDFASSYKDKKTLGIEHLLKKLHDIYYHSPIDSFQIKIGVKK